MVEISKRERIIMTEDGFEISPEATAKRTNREKGNPVTTRDWNTYPFIFKLDTFDSENWEGKVILDIGSGNKWGDPEATFPGAKMHAIDPEFEERIKWNTAHEKRQGVVQEIPYNENKFDLVLSSHAVPQHILPVDMPRAISEMIRVMKPGGEIRLAPCVRGRGDISLKMERALGLSGFEVDFAQKGTDGTITIIKSSKRLRKSIELKRKGWEHFHKTFFPEEEIRK